MIETRTIVVDVDNTIATHVNRDFEGATPNRPLITRLNALYDAGWTIIYHTARGTVSCNGDAALIEKLRGPVLRAWLEKHDVRYHQLIFGKPLGIYYVDDKAIRPDEFLELDFERAVGGSGAIVELLGGRVIKKGPGTKEQELWYRRAAGLCSVPRVNTYYGETLDMERIRGLLLSELCTSVRLNELLKILQRFKKKKVPSAGWKTMVERVRAHAVQNAVPLETEILRLIDRADVHAVMNDNASFCHGDLTLENVIVREEDADLYMIDPNTPPMVYQGWLLDLGKIYQSLHYDYEGSFYPQRPRRMLSRDVQHLFEDVKKRYQRWHKFALLIELTHYVRMLRYKSDAQKPLVRQRIVELYEEVKGCF